MLRSIAKSCAAFAYSSVTARRRTAIPFIAAYHRVVEDFERSRHAAIPSLLISTRMLERHIDWIGKRFTFASLDDVGAQLAGDCSFRKPLAAITFDDGYADVYHHAFPLLKRKGIPFGVFAVTNLIGTRRPQVFDRLYLLLRLAQERELALAATLALALRSRGYDAQSLQNLRAAEEEPFALMTIALNTFPQAQIEAAVGWLEQRLPIPQHCIDDMTPLSWEMIRTMHRAGVTIGSHTASHALLPTESAETVWSELVQSRQLLARNTGTVVNHFAYPDGRFNPDVVRHVHEAGYQFGYGICLSRDERFPLMTIPRKVLWERSSVNALGWFSPSIMHCHAHRVFDRKQPCEHNHMTRRQTRSYGTVA